MSSLLTFLWCLHRRSKIKSYTEHHFTINQPNPNPYYLIIAKAISLTSWWFFAVRIFSLKKIPQLSPREHIFSDIFFLIIILLQSWYMPVQYLKYGHPYVQSLLKVQRTKYSPVQSKDHFSFVRYDCFDKFRSYHPSAVLKLQS